VRIIPTIKFIEGPHWNALQLERGWYIGQFDAAAECDPDTLSGPFESQREALDSIGLCDGCGNRFDHRYPCVS
jgi:hypothetical protein